MKLLLDENISSIHAHTLRDLGHDATSVEELGLSGSDDPIVRAVAIETDRILVTLDGDFANLLRYPPPDTPGVVRLRLNPLKQAAVDRALRFLVERLSGTDLRGKLAVVDEHRIRIRG